jgi:anthranilate phosphoribosyltransferase
VLTAHSQLALLSQHAAEGQDLTSAEIEQAIHDLLEQNISIETKAEFLMCLARKGETPREIADFAIILRDLALDPGIDIGLIGGKLLDTCGTGADGSNTFNVSTASALVLCAGGIPVAKHGNRSITSNCGSADVLEALGVNIEMSPSKLRDCVEKVKIGFVFAPHYHKTFKAIGPVRAFLAKQGKRTIFNILGPLVNPARPNMQVVGVFDPSITDLYAQVLSLMRTKRALIVHGYSLDKKPCLDELSSFSISKISQLHSNGKIETMEVDSSMFGFQPATIQDLKGGDAKTNAEIIRNLLSGKEQGPKLDFLVYNASVGFVLSGLAKDIPQGIETAREIVKSGDALKKLDELAAFSKS